MSPGKHGRSGSGLNLGAGVVKAIYGRRTMCGHYVCED
jgi:hypothetical protein